MISCGYRKSHLNQLLLTQVYEKKPTVLGDLRRVSKKDYCFGSINENAMVITASLVKQANS